MCHHELWPTWVSHPFSSLNGSLGFAGGKHDQKITIIILRLLQNFAIPGCFPNILFHCYPFSLLSSGWFVIAAFGPISIQEGHLAYASVKIEERPFFVRNITIRGRAEVKICGLRSDEIVHCSRIVAGRPCQSNLSVLINFVLFNIPCINSWCAKFFIGNIEMYLQFISFLHTDKKQVVEILPCVRQELNHSA